MKRNLFLSVVMAVFTFMVCSANNAPAAPQTDDNQMTKVELETTMGNIVVVLYNETPLHRDNFIKLVKEGYYDGVLFHRVIKDFMIQGGDGNSKTAGPDDMLGDGDPGYSIPAEFVYPQYFHKRGVLAAAREPDNVNPERRSSGSQFYIVTGRLFNSEGLKMMAQRIGKMTDEQIEAYTTVGGAPHLDGQYTVFGEVIEGMDVVDKIQYVRTNPFDRPLTDNRIMKATIVE